MKEKVIAPPLNTMGKLTFNSLACIATGPLRLDGKPRKNVRVIRLNFL